MLIAALRFLSSLRFLVFTAAVYGGGAFAAETGRHVVIITIDGFPAELWRRADVPTPNLKRLAEAGASANAMTVANPSLTWPNHTSIITGVAPRKHGVLFNGLLVRAAAGQPPRIDSGATKDQLVHAPTLYDRAHAAGLTTAESNWVAIRGASTITWSFPEFPKATDALVGEMMSAGALTAAELKGLEWGQPTNLPWHDGIWLRAATFMIEHHRPNLLLYHILTTDSVHHTYGPGNVASFAALAFADRLVGELVQTVERNGLLPETTFIITTDHGFKKVTHFAYPNVTLKQAGLLQVAGPRIVSSDVCVKGGGGVAMVYITDPARRDELKPRVRELLAASEGVAEVIDGNDGPALGMPSPAESESMGDFILYPKEGYAFRDSAVGEAVAAPAQGYGGTHGYQASDPQLDGIFIASGRGIKPGVRLERMSNLDVAPTAAHLLGIGMPDVDGRILQEIITEDTKSR